MWRRLAVGLVAAVTPVAPLAAQPACPMTYATFEFAVPHLDLKACPADLARANAFCRATTGSDAVHIFVFAQDGDQCLLTVKSYQEGQFELVIK